MAAVCLLTDPVAAKEPEDDPDPDVTASQAPEDNLTDTVLDPWMQEILDGERDFTTTNTYNNRRYSINDLRSFYFGDDQMLDTVVKAGKLAAVDLDRDGINELVITPEGDDEYLYSVVGYLILHRVGDEVYGYAPGWRSCEYIKSDGTFRWSGSAFNWGTARARFDKDEFYSEDITWCDNYSEDSKNYFVDGRKATREEFEAAYEAHEAKAEPTWYTYTDGILSAQPRANTKATGQNDLVPANSTPDTPLTATQKPNTSTTGSQDEIGQITDIATAAPLDAPLVEQNIPEDPNEWYKVAELVVYDLDAPDPVDYVHDWQPLSHDFNQNVSFQYDENTHILTYTYQGQTVEATIDSNDDIYRRMEQEGFSLYATGDQVSYWFVRDNDGDIKLELTIELFIGTDTVPTFFPGWVQWTLRFNGSGFDTVPESCQLIYPGIAYQ